jgi:recombination protein RecT
MSKDNENQPAPDVNAAENKKELVAVEPFAKIPKDLLQPAQQIAGFAKGLVGHKRAGEFITQLAVMSERMPDLAKCTTESLVSALMACVNLDLMPNTPEQDAIVIPYFNRNKNRFEAQFQVMYQGLVKLAYRSGQIKTMDAELVFEGDEFDYRLGVDRRLDHKPDLDVDRTDYSKVKFAYVTVKLLNGETKFEILTRKELDKVQETSKAGSTDAPWSKWPEAMAKKSVVKRITKLLPKSTSDNQLAYASALDSWSEAGLLRLQNGRLVEAEEKETSEDRQARIKEAENERKGLINGDFNAVPMEPATEGENDKNS